MKPHLKVAGLALIAASLVACGGGGASPFIAPVFPSSTSASAALSTSATTPVSLAEINNGSSASLTLPAVTAKANAKITLQSSLPSGATQPQAKTLAAKSRISDAIGASGLTVLDYVLVSSDTTVAAASTPSFNFTLKSPLASGSSAYIAELDLDNASAGWNVFLGPGSVSESSVTFAAQAIVPPLTLQANDTYVFALVVTSSSSTPPPGGSVSFTGSKSVNYAYTFDFDYPRPAPSATAEPTTLNYTVTANVSVGSSPFPTTAPKGTVVDEHISENDTSPLTTATFTTDSWVGLANSTGGFNELVYGQTLQEPTSANLPQTTTIYASPQIVDQFPETNGASWTNGPASTVNYTYASGDNGTHTIATNGTYTDKEQMGPTNGGGSVTWTENADGSGSIVGPYFGGGYIDSVTFSAPTPAPNPTSSPTLAVVVNYDPAVQAPPYNYPASQTIDDYVWYPYATGTAPTFYTETDTVKSATSLPAGCASSATANVDDVERKVTVLDTVVGFVETTTLDSYDISGIPVCLNTNDVLSYAYDEQGNEPYFLYIGVRLGLETVTTNETLAIQGAAPSTNAAVRTQSMTQANALVAALEAHQLGAFARERSTRIHSFIKAIRGGHH